MKKLLLAVGMIGVLVSVLVYFAINETPKDSVGIGGEATTSSQRIQEKPDSHMSEERIAAEHSSSNGATSRLSYAESAQYFAAQEEWYRQLGYFEPEDRVAYEGYPDETLEILGADGDILALHVLAQRRFDDGQLDEGKEALLLAAMHGSRAALVEMSDFDRSALFRLREGSNGGMDNRRTAAVSAAAWLEAAVILGDIRALTIGNILLSDEQIQFTDADLQEVTALAEERIETVNRARERSGMAPLSQVQMPANIKDGMLTTLRATRGRHDSGWGQQYLDQLND
jgi:hypothetical protein